MHKSWLRLFFALAACSWMPHWSCHYYRLETGSNFVVGSWEFSRLHSVVSLLVYSALIGVNLAAIERLPFTFAGGFIVRTAAFGDRRPACLSDR